MSWNVFPKKVFLKIICLAKIIINPICLKNVLKVFWVKLISLTKLRLRLVCLWFNFVFKAFVLNAFYPYFLRNRPLYFLEVLILKISHKPVTGYLYRARIFKTKCFDPREEVSNTYPCKKTFLALIFNNEIWFF